MDKKSTGNGTELEDEDCLGIDDLIGKSGVTYSNQPCQFQDHNYTYESLDEDFVAAQNLVIIQAQANANELDNQGCPGLAQDVAMDHKYASDGTKPILVNIPFRQDAFLENLINSYVTSRFDGKYKASVTAVLGVIKSKPQAPPEATATLLRLSDNFEQREVKNNQEYLELFKDITLARSAKNMQMKFQQRVREVEALKISRMKKILMIFSLAYSVCDELIKRLRSNEIEEVLRWTYIALSSEENHTAVYKYGGWANMIYFAGTGELLDF